MGLSQESLRGLDRRTAAVLALVALLTWVYWPALRDMARLWRTTALYSHGYMVPLMALAVLWARRRPVPAPAGAESLLGLTVLVVGGLLRLAGAYVGIDWLEYMSLLPCLSGVALTAGGRVGARWALPAIAVLAFMLPLPYQAEAALSAPLQAQATETSQRLLQLLGLRAEAEGNVLILDGTRVGVAEACSGLGMLLVLLGLATAMAFVRPRPTGDRLLLLGSAAPVAVAANVTRIAVTALFFRAVGSASARQVFHDAAGLVAFAAAFALVGLELLLCDVYRRARRPSGSAEPALPPPTSRAETHWNLELPLGSPAMLPRDTRRAAPPLRMPDPPSSGLRPPQPSTPAAPPSAPVSPRPRG